MDGRMWSQVLTTDLIALYRANPYLWKVTDKTYLNRNKKNEAYDKLVELVKPHFPEANREFVNKKFQSLRGSFRKENKKVKASARSGASEDSLYVPSLWYFDLLKFTADSDASAESVDNMGDEGKNSDKIEGQGVTQEQAEPQVESIVASPKGNKASTSTGTLNIGTSKRQKKKTFQEVQQDFMQKCTKALSGNDMGEVDEHEAVGIIVAKKLKRMEPLQAMYAEDMINDVLRKGLMGQLPSVIGKSSSSSQSTGSDTSAHLLPSNSAVHDFPPLSLDTPVPSPAPYLPPQHHMDYTALE